MATIPYPPASAYIVPKKHRNTKAHGWLARALDGLDWKADIDQPWFPREHLAPLLERVSQQPPPFQIAILKACVERMPWHRTQQHADRDAATHFHLGSLLYETATTLYQHKLPWTEADLCELLRLPRHTCGHGGDVTPPFHIAIEYARNHGMTRALMASLRDFMASLKRIGSAQVRHLKRKGGLLFVLDAEAGGKRNRCWSERFSAGLAALPAPEQAQWQRLVLDMTINDLFVMPKVWRPQATRILNDIGPERCVERLAAWWPDPQASRVWPVQTGGSHLLKYFIWLLSVAVEAPELEATATALVCSLADMDWKPRERGQKVMIAAAYFLAERPPAVSWTALQRLAAWSSSAPDGTSGTKITEVVSAYSARHKLKPAKARR